MSDEPKAPAPEEIARKIAAQHKPHPFDVVGQTIEVRPGVTITRSEPRKPEPPPTAKQIETELRTALEREGGKKHMSLRGAVRFVMLQTGGKSKKLAWATFEHPYRYVLTPILSELWPLEAAASQRLVGLLERGEITAVTVANAKVPAVAWHGEINWSMGSIVSRGGHPGFGPDLLIDRDQILAVMKPETGKYPAKKWVASEEKKSVREELEREFNEIIAELAKYELPPSELATAAGLARSHVSDLMNNKKPPTDNVVDRLHGVLLSLRDGPLDHLDHDWKYIRWINNKQFVREAAIRREELKYTQEKLDDLVGWARGYCSKVELGDAKLSRRRVGLPTVFKYLDVLRLRVGRDPIPPAGKRPKRTRPNPA